MKAHLHRLAPDTAHGTEANPGLSDLLEIAWRQNRLTAGAPLVLPPNYGQNSSMMPIDGWRYAPKLNEAAGPAPRDPQIAVYILTPAGSIQPNLQVPPVLMRAYQQDKIQFVGTGPIAYVPGGTAELAPAVPAEGGIPQS